MGSARIFVCNDIISLLEEVVSYLERSTKYWREDFLETYGFERDTREALAIIEAILRTETEFHKYLVKYTRNNFKDKAAYSTGYRSLIKKIVQHILQGQMYLEELIEEHKESKPIRKNAIWFLIRAPAPKRNYRQLFVAEAQALRSQLDGLGRDQEFLQGPGAQVMADEFKDDLSTEAFEFWTKSLGLKTTADWNKFQDIYTVLYGKRANGDLKYIKDVIFKENGTATITIYGFITLAREYGFPFEQHSHLDEKRAPAEEIRTEIAKMIMNLMVEFSSADMQANFLSITKWYADVNRKDQNSINARADEWATLLKKSRLLKDEEKTDAHKQVDRVDLARRSISLLYQRYMVIWRIGQISREMLKDVDFPGRSRIKDFLRFVQPLDYANYHQVIGAEPEQWYHRKPNVYKFLRFLITDVSADEKTNGNSNNVPTMSEKPVALTTEEDAGVSKN